MQLFKSGGGVLLFFRSIAQQSNHQILNSSAPLTSPFICARFVGRFLGTKMFLFRINSRLHKGFITVQLVKHGR
jgi:hypothetical protein